MGEGCVGNSDVYGLGVRCGMYLRWLACLVVKRTLPDTRSALPQTYMIFLVAICATVLVMSVQYTCTFVSGVVILYYMFFGGEFCVFTWLDLTTKRANRTWLGVTWYRGILYILYFFRAGPLRLVLDSWLRYGVCQTSLRHLTFFLSRLPGDSFLKSRFLLALSTLSGFVQFGLMIPASVVLFLPDLARSRPRVWRLSSFGSAPA